MIRKLALATATCALAFGLSAAPALAAGPTESGNACQGAGMATVKRGARASYLDRQVRRQRGRA